MPIKVFHSYPGWLLSGVGSWSMKLIESLDANDFDQKILITGQPDENGRYQMPPKELPCINLMTPRNVSRRVYQANLKSFFTSQAPCVFLPNFDFDAASVSGLLPVSVAICAGIRSDDPVYYRYAKTFSRYWDSAIAVSRYLYETFGNRFPELQERLSCIPNGVKVPPSSKLAEKIPTKIVYCNRISREQKRVFDVLAVARELQDRGVGFEIEVLGSGPDEDEFQKQIATEGLHGKVIFRGQQSHGETLKTMETASFFLLPSAYEGMPNSLLEAMAVGAVPFAYDIPSGVPEIIEHGLNGYLFPIGDTVAMAEKLAEHLRDPNRSFIIRENARKKIIQRFSVEAMAEAYGSHFRFLGERAEQSACGMRDGVARLLEPTSPVARIKRKLDPRPFLRFLRGEYVQ
jgi:glycosyltransferase involved in cell wall biosynthesis